MSLQNRLDAFKNEKESSIPPEALKMMHRATNELAASGIMERVLKIGDQAPDFTLPDTAGQTVRSSEMLKKGPLVVSFYRGVW